ncbi:MAG: DUF262 domain-containing protein [Lachnospiraceae bacterium]|nr:DUF262 domain-containing protein [Lachnospiraceae bacterium]
MSQFQMPITIYQAMNYIDGNHYLLPAFQREFVWKSEQIEKLFDSLMRGYPTSSMLFWKVKGDTKTKWKFYRFINTFVLDAKGYSNINELYNTASSTDFYAILDGQQRLTAMRIGLFGTYSYHEPRKSWEYSDVSFPKRHMYLNLTRLGGVDDDCKYFFEFKKDSETNVEDFYKDGDEVWFRAGAVVPFHSSGEEISDYFEGIQLKKEERQVIKRLENTVFTENSITFYEEDEQKPDKAVKIFTRINSGGTFLSFSDIVFSLMVSNWDKKDAKTEIGDLIASVEEKGFSISKDYIVKAFLYLHHKNVKTEINSFNKEFCAVIEDHWDSIKGAILSLFDLLRSFGLTAFSLTSNNATLPILYYIYHKNVFADFTNRVGYVEERKEIKRWILSAILRKTFGGQSDSTLQQTRKVFTDDIDVLSISPAFIFDGKVIDASIKNMNAVDEEFLDSILGTQKDNCYAFPILSLLYPHLDYKNNDFHKDHLHAEDLYGNLSEELREKYPFRVYNSILNLQMLDKNENESKGKSLLSDWVEKSCTSADDRKRFLKAHLIPDVDLSLENFEEFVEMRREMLKEILRKVFADSNANE